MSIDNTPIPDDAEGQDRRREPRLGFERRCMLNVLEPAWAMTMRPILGETENINLHGLRVNIEGIEEKIAQAWTEAVAEDEDVRAEVMLPELAEFPPLRGQIVWVSAQPAGPGEPPRTTCSVGILFAVLREKEAQAVKKLVESLA